MAKQFECEVCQKEFKCEKYLINHMKLIHEKIEKQKNECDICGKMFFDLKMHQKNAHQNEKFVCEICQKAYISEVYLNRHMKVHQYVSTTNSSLECDTRGKLFSSIQTFRTHKLYVHVKERKFHCSECNNIFGRNSTLMMHIRNVHGDGTRNYKCDKCEKAYKMKGDLDVHINSVHKKIRVKCNICCKEYTNRKSMKFHRKYVHDMKRKSREKCEICQQKVLNLKLHKKVVHLKTRNIKHKCDSCEKEFSQKPYLRNHIKAAHNKMPRFK